MIRQDSNTATIGRLIEVCPLWLLLVSMALTVFLSANWFYCATPFGHGVAVESDPLSLHYFDALYFSVVTFSSLGYGDMSPSGIGKLVATAEVIAGLVLISLTVAKLASERQSILTQLLYTSDQERRLSSFADEMEDLRTSLNGALLDHNHGVVAHTAERMVRLVYSIHRYLRFQAREGGLLDYGNHGPLRRTLAELRVFQHAADRAWHLGDTVPEARTELARVVRVAGGVAGFLQPLVADSKSLDVLRKLTVAATEFAATTTRYPDGPPSEKAEYLTQITEPLLESVDRLLPQQPWPNNVHLEIAQRLRISNSHARRCVEELTIRRQSINSLTRR